MEPTEPTGIAAVAQSITDVGGDITIVGIAILGVLAVLAGITLLRRVVR